MDGKENIIAKILEDAKAQKDSIISEAKAFAKSKKNEAESWAKEYKDTQNRILEKEMDDIIERKLTVAELEVRKIILKSKQDLIDRAFLDALNKLRKIKKADYLSLVLRLIEENADENDEIVLSCDGVLSVKDLENESIVKKKKLKFSKDKGSFNGGIMLIGKNSDKDLTFESVVKDAREELTSDIIPILF